MSVAPVAFSPWTPIAPIAGAGATAAPAGPTAAGDSFAATLAHGLDAVSATQAKADNLAVQAATGSLTDVHDYTIAATQAQLATELTVAVRNKALEAFNDIMRMPL
jgi:flagellar hook-basal body complex protein FliE